MRHKTGGDRMGLFHRHTMPACTVGFAGKHIHGGIRTVRSGQIMIPISVYMDHCQHLRSFEVLPWIIFHLYFILCFFYNPVKL